MLLGNLPEMKQLTAKFEVSQPVQSVQSVQSLQSTQVTQPTQSVVPTQDNMSVFDSNVGKARHRLFMCARTKGLYVLPESITCQHRGGGVVVTGKVVPIVTNYHNNSQHQPSSSPSSSPSQQFKVKREAASLGERYIAVYTKHSKFRNVLATTLRAMKKEDGKLDKIAIHESKLRYVMDGVWPVI